MPILIFLWKKLQFFSYFQKLKKFTKGIPYRYTFDADTFGAHSNGENKGMDKSRDQDPDPHNRCRSETLLYTSQYELLPGLLLNPKCGSRQITTWHRLRSREEASRVPFNKRVLSNTNVVGAHAPTPKISPGNPDP